jgi:hypothetical protein
MCLRRMLCGSLSRRQLTSSAAHADSPSVGSPRLCPLPFWMMLTYRSGRHVLAHLDKGASAGHGKQLLRKPLLLPCFPARCLPQALPFCECPRTKRYVISAPRAPLIVFFFGNVGGFASLRLCVWCSGKFMSAFEKGGEVSFDEEAAFCEHFTMHELPDSGSLPSAACRKVMLLLLLSSYMTAILAASWPNVYLGFFYLSSTLEAVSLCILTLPVLASGLCIPGEIGDMSQKLDRCVPRWVGPR